MGQYRRLSLLVAIGVIASHGPVKAAAPAGGVLPHPLVVRDGKPAAIIVLGDHPSHAASEGAAVLAAHLLEMSGAHVPVVMESSLTGARVEAGRVVTNKKDEAADTFILVGQSQLATALGVTDAGLGPGGIHIKTAGNTVVLLGMDDRTPSDPDGSEYAVTTFLEALGVRYLWPGELGKVIPHRTNIDVPTLNISYTPQIKQRRIRNQVYGSRLQTGLDMLGEPKDDYIRLRAEAELTVAQSPNWFSWQHLGGSLGLATGHSYGDLWTKYGATHPEWFALQANGSRDQSKSPDRARVCESNVDLQAAIARDRIAELDQNPNLHSVSIDENDGGNTTFCMCPECKKLDALDGKPIVINDSSTGKNIAIPWVSLTDRVVFFWNGIAEGVTKVHPDALLTVRAYSTYETPPVHRKLNPSLVIEQVSGSYLNDSETKTWLAEWKQWSAMASKISWRPNIYETSRRIGLPVIFVHKMAADFSNRAHNNMVSTDIDSCFNNWATGGLNLYVMARLHWNPDLDVDATIDDYCKSGFGAGSVAVKRYLGRIEAITDRMATGDDGSHQAQIKFLTAAYDPATIATLRADLDDAKKAAKGDEPSLRRIEFLRIGLDFTEVQAQAYQMQESIQANGGKPVDQAATVKFLVNRAAANKSLFEKNVMAVNVPYTLWAAEGNLSTLKKFAPRPAGQTGPDKTVIDADERGRPIETPGR